MSKSVGERRVTDGCGESQPSRGAKTFFSYYTIQILASDLCSIYVVKVRRLRTKSVRGRGVKKIQNGCSAAQTQGCAGQILKDLPQLPQLINKSPELSCWKQKNYSSTPSPRLHQPSPAVRTETAPCALLSVGHSAQNSADEGCHFFSADQKHYFLSPVCFGVVLRTTKCDYYWFTKS